jgi:hypothetical protein
MIVVKPFGGLGNQMFQYAAARRLSLQHGTTLGLDLRWFSAQDLRSLDLMHLQVEAERPGADDLLPGLAPDWTGASRRTRLRLGLAARRRGWRLLTDSTPGVFDASVLAAPDRSILVGYWQSQRYFEDVAPTLRHELAPRQPLSHDAAVVAAEIRDAGGVSLHVRRGDFTKDPLSQRTHGVCSPDYYRDAMSQLDDRLGRPVYYLFSDDPDWVEENISHRRTRMVSSPKSTWPAYEEMALMSACRAHIVSNSSFSWWGAWLGADPDKVVVAPARWFTDPSFRSDDIVPPNWVRL